MKSSFSFPFTFEHSWNWNIATGSFLAPNFCNPQINNQINSSHLNSLPFMIQKMLSESLQENESKTKIYDSVMWSKLPQDLCLKQGRIKKGNSNFVKQLITKSKIFSKEFSKPLHQSISMGKGCITLADFKIFYDELDNRDINSQRIFHYFNKSNEFVITKSDFEKKFGEFVHSFKKELKSSNLIIEYVMKNEKKTHDCKKEPLFLEYIKLITNFKNSINKHKDCVIFGNKDVIDKRNFSQIMGNYNDFPLIYFFEFLKLEKFAIKELNSESDFESNLCEKQYKRSVKKILMAEVKKILKRCEQNGDLTCSCSFCRWFFYFKNKKNYIYSF